MEILQEFNTKPKIIVNNTTIEVWGLDEKENKRLYKAFSIFDKGAFYDPRFKRKLWDGFKHFGTIKKDKLENEYFIVPIGLYNDLSSVIEDYIDLDPKNDFEIIDNRDKELLNLVEIDEIQNGYKLGKKVLRDYQIDAVNNLMQNTWLGLPMPNGVVHAATNAGKTSIAVAIFRELYQRMKRNKLVMLFVVHSLEIANQFVKNWELDTKLTCGFIGNGKWNVKPVTVALTSTLYSKHKRNEECFKELSTKTVVVVYDECHHVSAKGNQKVLSILENVIVRVGLTGTTNESDDMKRMKLFSAIGPVLIRITNAELIERGVSAKPTCYIYTVNKPVFEYNPKLWARIYSEGIADNKHRNDLIIKLVNEEYKKKHSILVLVERISQGEHIYNGINKLNGVEFIQGMDEGETRQTAIDKLANGKIKVLISTAILDEGVDVSGINTIIYARGLKSERKLLQGLGRGLRKKVDGSGLTYIDFYDVFNSYTNKHSEERIQTLKEEGFDVIMK